MTDAEPGTYALLLKLDKQERITIGKLGTFDFPAGYYLYVGSALGPGGLRARLARHRRGSESSPGRGVRGVSPQSPLTPPERVKAAPLTALQPNSDQTGKKLHWHIDYLLQRVQLIEVWSVASEERLECKWGEVASRLSGAQVPVRGFGSSDCRCPTHLIYFSARPDREQFEQALQTCSPIS
jgi:Uri superfamily endonuclease